MKANSTKACLSLLYYASNCDLPAVMCTAPTYPVTCIKHFLQVLFKTSKLLFYLLLIFAFWNIYKIWKDNIFGSVCNIDYFLTNVLCLDIKQQMCSAK
ncbi:hypothetical protein GDO78_009524 [Eleutherodactylus coqui]|uniref:Uncharacterized protein n=1 Tax=Eleutherodactylus coqui TaxID=57060 RepID=A0A8J6F8U4_ELECQ|nr:hypothetical protein GDO78_009524 [Eleutherodactylus coqui]